MKKDNRFLTISAYAFLTALAVLLFAVILFRMEGIASAVGSVLTAIRSVIIGIAIALILNPTLTFFEQFFGRLFCKKKERPRLRHALGLITTYLLLFLLIAGVIWILIPQLIDAVTTLGSQSEHYLDDLQVRIDSFIEKIDLPDLNVGETQDTLHFNLVEVINEWLSSLLDLLTTELPRLLSYASTAFSGFKDYFLGIIISIYFLAFRRSVSSGLKKIIASLFSESTSETLRELGRITYHTYLTFFTAKFYDATIVCCITYIALSVLNIPYAILIGLFIGIMNLVPFVGPIIGGFFGWIIVLIFAPKKALLFIIIVIAIQALDSYVIEKHVIGSSVIGLSNFWILVSVTIMGGLFGFSGMLLAAPTFAMGKILILRLIERVSRKKAEKKKTEGSETDPQKTEE